MCAHGCVGNVVNGGADVGIYVGVGGGDVTAGGVDDVVDDVVDELGSRAEIEHIKTILERGTSADRQVQIYNETITNGANEQDALIAVVDFLTEETMRGVK